MWEELTGVSATQAVGRSPHDCLPPPVADIVMARWRECLRDKKDVTFGLRLRGRNWEAKLVPVQDACGGFDRLISTARDVTEREEMQGKLQELNATLEERVERAISDREAALVRSAHAERMQALGQLAGGIAHDFNNVLQGITGCAALIGLRSHEPATCERLAKIAGEAAERGASITRRLLAFSRQDDLRVEAIDVKGMVGDLTELLAHALGAGIQTVVDVGCDVPPALADKGQLETVLLNLATNARDAMPGGGTLTFRTVAETIGADAGLGLVPGRYVRLAVSDTGCGMDRATLARVTEPFFTTKPVGKGTGLGLSMAQGFAEQSGGGYPSKVNSGRERQ